MGIFTEYVSNPEPVFVTGDERYELQVIGAANYQKYLAVLNKRRSKKGCAQPLIAKLHYENNNPYDKNAIRVVIDGGIIGYLARQDARLFRMQIEKGGQEGAIIACNAQITGGKRTWGLGKTDFSVWLDLPITQLCS